MFLYDFVLKLNWVQRQPLQFYFVLKVINSIDNFGDCFSFGGFGSIDIKVLRQVLWGKWAQFLGKDE